MLYTDDAFIFLLQDYFAVIAVFYIQFRHIVHRLEKAERREVKEWCNDSVAYADQKHHRKHTVYIYAHRKPHDKCQNRYEDEARNQCRHKACKCRAE